MTMCSDEQNTSSHSIKYNIAITEDFILAFLDQNLSFMNSPDSDSEGFSCIFQTSVTELLGGDFFMCEIHTKKEN